MSKTLSQITSALENDKTDIRNAILSGGGTCPEGHGFDSFASDIGTIPIAHSLTNGTFTNYYDITNQYALLDQKLCFVQFSLSEGYNIEIRPSSSPSQEYKLFTISNFKVDLSTIKSIHGSFYLNYSNTGSTLTYDTELKIYKGIPSSPTNELSAYVDNNANGNLVFGVYKIYNRYSSYIYHLDGRTSRIAFELN